MTSSPKELVEELTFHRQIFDIGRTNNPNFNVSRVVLQLYLPKQLMQGIKSRMKM